MKVDHRLWFKAKIQSIIEKACEAEVEESAHLYLSLWSHRKLRRQEEGRFAAWNVHPWILLLNNTETRDPTSYLGRRFLRRFRIPAPFFLDWLVPTAREVNLFNTNRNPKGSLRQEQIPLEIKLLICLRILGRGATNDDMSEPSYVSESYCGVIFRQFIVNFSRLFKEQFIKQPTTSELRSIMQAYALVGFPGCVGSIDCTHIRWWNCPSKHRNSCHGKEGYRLLGFQVIVDNTKRILHVSKGYFGSLNDQNICDIDPIIYNDNGGIVNLARDRRFLYNDVKFDLYDSDGNVDRIVGAYYISDGGYPPISVFISPTNRRFDKAAVYWSEFLESVRKDVECTFGILKSRFRGLMYGLRLRSQVLMEAAVHTCCILHNMLHTINGYDNYRWRQDDIWTTIHPDEDVAENDIPLVHFQRNTSTPDHITLELQAIKATINKPRKMKIIGVPINNVLCLQRRLITHFDVRYRLGLSTWPKRMSKKQVIRIPISQTVVEFNAIRRALAMACDHLFVTESKVRIEDNLSGEYTKFLGKGLFTRHPIKAGETIAEFQGEWIEREEMLKRRSEGKEDYIIGLNKNLFLDCYNYRDICKASMTNSPVHAFNLATRSIAKANAYIFRNDISKRVFLVANKADIKPGAEIIYNYNFDSHDQYPDVLL